jgi:hypothetical protein
MKQISPEAFDPTWLDQEPIDDETNDDEVWLAETEMKTILEVPGFT